MAKDEFADRKRAKKIILNDVLGLMGLAREVERKLIAVRWDNPRHAENDLIESKELVESVAPKIIAIGQGMKREVGKLVQR